MASTSTLPLVTERSRALWIKAAAAILLVVVAVVAGRAFGHHIPELESWIAQHGFIGEAVFVIALVLATSMFVPDSLFAVMAGVLFGLARGTVLVVMGVMLTAAFNFVISRKIAREPVRRGLERVPKLAAIERAVNDEGFRFQFLLRLTPISPVTLNYLLGVTSTRFPTFLTACLGMIPGLFVEVYLGHVAKHVAELAHDPRHHERSHTILTLGGLVLCIVVLAYVTRLARRAVARQEARDLASPTTLPSS